MKNLQKDRIKSFKNNDINLNTIPKIVNIEPTNLCQFDCIMCSRKEIDNYGEMSLVFLENMLSNNKEYFFNQSTWFELAGEPLIHSQIGEFIRISKKYIRKAKIITNGVLLKEKGLELIESGLDEIIVSIDSLNNKNFLEIKNPKVNFTLDNLLDNISYFIDINKNKVSLKVQFINFADNIDEKAIIKAMNNIGVKDIIIKKLSNRCGKSEYSFESLNNDKCFYPWERIIITHDGKVGICCHDLTTSLEMGNLNNYSIKEVWNGEEMKKLRKKHIEGNLKGTACYNCSAKVTLNRVDDIKKNEFKFIKI